MQRVSKADVLSVSPLSDYCPSLAKFYHNIVPHAKPLAFEALHPGPSAHLHHLLPEIHKIKILGYHSVLIIPEMNIIIQKVDQAHEASAICTGFENADLFAHFDRFLVIIYLRTDVTNDIFWRHHHEIKSFHGSVQ